MSRSGNSRRGNRERGMVGNGEWKFFPGLLLHIEVGTGGHRGHVPPSTVEKIGWSAPLKLTVLPCFANRITKMWI